MDTARPPRTSDSDEPPDRRRSRLLLWAVVPLLAALAVTSVVVTEPPRGPATGTSGEQEPLIAVDLGVPHTPDDRVAPDAVAGIEGRAYAVYDSSTGEFLAARDLHGRRSVASLFKLLTAWVVIEAGEPDRVVTIPDLPLRADESNIGLEAGEQQRRDVLLRAMLIVSANDAARALAIDVAGDLESFAARMNTAAEALGLAETHAVDPAGLDAPTQYSSAHDMVKLGVALMERPEFRTTVRRRSARLHETVHPATNDLLGTYLGADGVKTGYTDDAGWCLLASATRDDRRIFAIVLGAPSQQARDQAVTRLLDWAFATTDGG